jgi:cbb3-type cytochrome oxidase subunit 1
VSKQKGTAMNRVKRDPLLTAIALTMTLIVLSALEQSSMPAVRSVLSLNRGEFIPVPRDLQRLPIE